MTLVYILGGMLISYGILASINLILDLRWKSTRLSDSAAGSLNDAELKEIQADAYFQQGILLHSINDFSAAILKYEKAVEVGGLRDDLAQHIKFAQASHPFPKSLALEAEADSDKQTDMAEDFSPLQTYLHKREEGQQKAAPINYSTSEDSAQKALTFLQEGQEYHKKGLITESISAYDQAINADPQLINAYIHRAMALIKAKDYSKAIDDLTAIINEDPGNFDILYKRANIYLHQNLLDEAVKDYTAALDINPKSAKALNRRGTAFFRKENYTYAVADFAKALFIDPDFTEALENLDRAKQLKFEQIRAQAENRQHDDEEAIGASGMPESSEQVFYQGLLHLQEKDIAKALVSFNRVIRAIPDHPSPYFERGCIHLTHHRYAIAIGDFDKVIELDPDFGDAYCKRGQALAGLSKYEAALADFNKALSINPRSMESLMQRGLCHVSLKNTDYAFADFSLLIEIDSRNGQAYYQRGLLFQAADKDQQAEDDFNKACKLGINEACEAFTVRRQ